MSGLRQSTNEEIVEFVSQFFDDFVDHKYNIEDHTEVLDSGKVHLHVTFEIGDAKDFKTDADGTIRMLDAEGNIRGTGEAQKVISKARKIFGRP